MLERLAAQRAGAYEAAADVAIDTDGIGVEEVASRVMQELASCIG
jgi:shikimate kinase